MLLSMTTLAQLAVYGHIVASGGQTRPIVNVFTYDAAGSALYPGTTKVTLATNWRLSKWPAIRARLHTDYVGDNIWVWFPSVTGDVFQATGVVPQNGQQTGNRLPINLAVYVSLRSGLRGPWYYGSKRFAPLSDTHVVGDELTPAGQTAWQGAANACTTTFATGAGPTFVLWHPVVWSRQLSTPPPDLNAQVGADILTAHANKTVSTWRHRRERTVR